MHIEKTTASESTQSRKQRLEEAYNLMLRLTDEQLKAALDIALGRSDNDE